MTEDSPATQPAAASYHLANAGEYFLRVLVVALGIVLGLVAALFVSLYMGWFEIGC